MPHMTMQTTLTDLSLPPRAPRTFGLSWPLFVALAAMAGVLGHLPVSRSLSDPDSYWHLAAGRWILEHGRVPSGDPFSHSMNGAPWTAHEWLSELLIYGVHSAAGWGGLMVMAAATFALTLALLNRFLLARMEPVHALLFTGFAGGMLLSHLLARPHVIVWPLLALWVAKLVSASEARRGPPWWLLGLMVLWANLHGSFTLGLLLAAAIALDAVIGAESGQRRATALRWGAFVLLAIVAALVTPSGAGGLTYTLYVMNQHVALATIGEWLSPNFQQPQPLEVWLLLILGIALTGRVRLPWLRMLVLLGLVHLALKHQRNMAVLGLVSPFLMAAPLARHWLATASGGRDAETLDRWFKAFADRARWPAIAAALSAMALIAAAAVHWREPAPDPSITPSAAFEAAQAAGVKGPVLNDYSFGGYLIHRGVPVFVDGRSDMYGDPFLEKMIAGLQLRDRRSLLELLDAYPFGWTLLAKGTPAVAVLDDLPGWRRLYGDDTAVVHVRIAPPPAR